ncbi:MAG: hypothetical protein SGILL_010020 [Bacillariaceae sp.]
MPITMDDFEEGVVGIEDEKIANFTMELAASFLGAGEAKWWDAQLVIAMADVIADVPIVDSVCAEWLETSGFKVNLDWRSVDIGSGAKNPYGSITDVEGLGPQAYFCRHGNVTNMQEHYWDTLAGMMDPGTVADKDVWLRELSDGDSGGGSGAASVSSSMIRIAIISLAFSAMYLF